MALFPQSFLDDLKSQTDIVAVVGDVVPLKKAGATWKGLCPFHQEKSPSFTVNRDKGVFYCFGCGAGGDAVRFVEMHLKIAFPEAVRFLAQRAGMLVPEPTGGPEDREAAAERDALAETGVGLHPVRERVALRVHLDLRGQRAGWARHLGLPLLAVRVRHLLRAVLRP